MACSRATDARRILVVGCPGAGKTTFARRLAALSSLPLIHLDYHFWRAGWQLPDLTAWREKVAALAASDDWIMDGNYSNTYSIRMPRAEAIVWLDYSRATCMRRVLTRMVKGYGRTRPELPEGCPERFDLPFLRYVWEFPMKHRPRIASSVEQFGRHLDVVRLDHDRAADAFLTTAGRA
jgi:adenylate kinase family enzyme